MSLSDADAIELARAAVAIEAHYSRRRGEPTPMDIEWAKDGTDGRLWILQARPETVHRAGRPKAVDVFTLESTDAVALVTGKAVGQKIGVGPARLVRSRTDLQAFQTGEVLVAAMTDPDWEPVMKRAAAIVTDRGGRTCHAAIVSRELGVPCVVGTGTGDVERSPTGETVTVSCAEGETGPSTAGALPFDASERRPRRSCHGRPPRVMLNVGNPDEAFRLAAPAQRRRRPGPDRVHHRQRRARASDGAAAPGARDGRRACAPRSTRSRADTPSRGDYFVDRLAEGVADDRRRLLPEGRDRAAVGLQDQRVRRAPGGGRDFEPVEENPMLGFRGASRYDHPHYREASRSSAARCGACASDMGLDERQADGPVLPHAGGGPPGAWSCWPSHGLRRGEDGLEVYVMCEIPSNVILAREFAEVFDGFSIGSNDLTQLVARRRSRLGARRARSSTSGTRRCCR